MQQSLAPAISIVIANHDGEAYVTELAQSLADQQYAGDVEVIFVDDASCDRSVEGFVRGYPAAIIARSEENIGHSGSCNLGARLAQNEIIVFLNTDVIVDRDWLTFLVEPFGDSSIAAVQSKLMSTRGESLVDSAGGVVDFFCWPSEIGREFGPPRRDRPAWRVDRDIFSACCAAAAFRRSVFHECGEFDERMFGNMNDVDLSWRLRLLGWRIVLAAKSIVFHKRGGTMMPTDPAMIEDSTKNVMLVALKNACRLQIVACAMHLTLWAFLRSMFYLFAKDFKRLRGTLRGFAWLFHNRHQIARDRLAIRSRRVVSDQSIIRLMSKRSFFVMRVVAKALRLLNSSLS